MTEKHKLREHSCAHVVFGILCFMVTLAAAALQGVYLLLVRPRGYEFTTDWIPVWIITIGIGFCLLGFTCFLWWNRGVRIGLLTAVLATFVVGLLILPSFFTRESLVKVSFSPDYKHLLVLKGEEESGQIFEYRTRFYLFARKQQQFSYTVKNDMKLQWLADDVCAVTYESTDQQVHQYIATYGDRGNGISYYQVGAVIQGKWTMGDKNTAGWFMTANKDGITVGNAGFQETYAYGDCVQFGTLALALCNNGLPRYNIILNEDCSLSDSGLISRGGTVTLCQVSMDRTAPIEMFCTTPEIEQAVLPEEEMPTQEEMEESAIAQMKNFLSEDPTLSGMVPQDGIIKIESDSDNLYWIALLALKAERMDYAVNGVDVRVQLNQCALTAGDKKDCLLSLETTELAVTPGNQGSPPEGGSTTMRYRIRLMRGEGAYLALILYNDADGSQGLDQRKGNPVDLSAEPAYHFFIPGKYDTTYMYVNRLSPADAAEKLYKNALLSDYPKAVKSRDENFPGYLLDAETNTFLYYDGIAQDLKNYRFWLVQLPSGDLDSSQGLITTIGTYQVNILSGEFRSL
ncbi:hypothetical protein [Diplocloster agilis]|uniref:hypothetical protein n=1 Tax=Diplocloster agilis TaxID=2850323 RepID=UPI0008209F50|nr:hypothetical protein [Suonthocola fibrivorans]MCU6732894.1 hypothetical protein [Suonthocola fibrivorans]SCI66253.1 Uncharacterised protein [uncultured Clostridium sp.]